MLSAFSSSRRGVGDLVREQGEKEGERALTGMTEEENEENETS